jgi:hypothetical protein
MRPKSKNKKIYSQRKKVDWTKKASSLGWRGKLIGRQSLSDKLGCIIYLKAK